MDLSALLNLPACLRGDVKFTIGGGLPRSGTTYAEAVLQAHPSILCFQEFMPLKTSAFADFLSAIDKTMTFERNIWTDAQGYHWRGYGAEEDRPRLTALIVASLASTTHTRYLLGKSIKEIRTLFCKTPDAEINLLALKSTLEFSYVHCIRDPVACAKSNWQMPWLSNEDLDQWIPYFGQSLRASAVAFEAIQEAGIATHVLRAEQLWMPMTRQATLGALFDFLGIPDRTEHSLTAASSVVDPWPVERRRRPTATFAERHREMLEAHEGTKLWRRTFSYARADAEDLELNAPPPNVASGQ